MLCCAAARAEGRLEELVCVWAVDGLTGVVLSGLPGGAVTSSKAAAPPRAVLWGKDTRSVAWLMPQETWLADDLRWVGLCSYVMSLCIV